MWRALLPTLLLAAVASQAQPLPGTRPLALEGDPAARMLEGIDRYLARETARSVDRRTSFWKRDFSSPEAYEKSVAPNRERFRRIIGLADQRVPFDEPALDASAGRPAPAASTAAYRIHAVRWPVLDGVEAAGLLLEPSAAASCSVVALPDAGGAPEQLVAQFAGRIAASGCQVLIPVLLSRRPVGLVHPDIRRPTNQTHREFVYRMAFEMGRHVIGYEVQKVLAGVDWFTRAAPGRPVGIIGYGEGGLVALYSAAADTRIQAAAVSGYFQPREDLWREPVYRNVWGLLREFGDAEIASLVAPRALILEAARAPETGPPPSGGEFGSGAAPGFLSTPTFGAVRAEFDRAKPVFDKLGAGRRLSLVVSREGRDDPGSDAALSAFLAALGRKLVQSPAPEIRQPHAAARERRQFEQIVAHVQELVRRSPATRRRFWSKADTSSLEAWNRTSQWYRDYLWEEVIGKLPAPVEPLAAETRPIYDQPRWTGYEVRLPLDSDLFAYGILLLPRNLKPGERRPVVVAQHGRAGRPQGLIAPESARTENVYKKFAAQLADRGFIVYAPQNPYIFEEQYRTLQRKANPLKLSLFSFIAAQHQRTLDWLAALPSVDPARIGFYGLSYGGKTAVRVPPLLGRYALSICSGDFGEYIGKMAGIDRSESFMYTIEHEMYEFDLGNTFNYADLAGLMAPRPFMVERGHRDGVGFDEWVAYEFAKVRRFYTQLGIPGRAEIEFFEGVHEIRAEGTFRFLHRHLNWPEP
jgi:dienelactone hydrolase